MRYGTETRMETTEVLKRARDFFGLESELGLPEIPGDPGTLTFATDIGGVAITVTSDGRKTDVTVISREYDSWAEKFIRSLH